MTAPAEDRPAAHNSADIGEHLAFMNLDATALAAVRTMKPLLDRELPKALDIFYDKLREQPEIRRLFSNEAHMKAAKGAQLGHWEAIGLARFDAAFMENVRRVGRSHARVGLDPKWYIGGYSLILEHLVKSALAEIWPKSLLGGSGAKAKAASEGIAALVKAVFLDMDLAISVYLDALTQEWKQAEAAKRASDEAAARSVEAIATGLRNLSNKALSYRIDNALPSAFETLRADFNSAISQMQDALRAVDEAAQTISVGGDEISTASNDLSQRTEQQAASLEETAAALEEVSATVAKTAEGAKQANQIVSLAREKAQRSGAVVGEATAAMDKIEKSSGEIGQIIGVIDEIAFQTNLLALNAGVEAARAGEAGRGFAVVASEVRALAQRSAEAAKDIKRLITASSSEVQVGVKLVAETGAILSEIASGIEGVNSVVVDIASSTREQSSALSEISTAVNQLDQMTQQNAAMSEQSTAASQSLTRVAGRLTSLTAEFEIGARAEIRRLAPTPPARAKYAPASRKTSAPPEPTRLKVANGADVESADWSEF